MVSLPSVEDFELLTGEGPVLLGQLQEAEFIVLYGSLHNLDFDVGTAGFLQDLETGQLDVGLKLEGPPLGVLV